MTPSLPSLEAMVQAKGVEPLILSAAASKTAMYPNSNTPGYMSPLIFDYRRNGTLKPPGRLTGRRRAGGYGRIRTYDARAAD